MFRSPRFCADLLLRLLGFERAATSHPAPLPTATRWYLLHLGCISGQPPVTPQVASLHSLCGGSKPGGEAVTREGREERGKSETSQGKGRRANAKGLMSLDDDVFAGVVVANLSSSTVIFFLQQGGFSPWLGFLPRIDRNLCSALNPCKFLLTRADQSCCPSGSILFKIRRKS